MKVIVLTRPELLNLARRTVDEHGGQSSVARRLGISRQAVHSALSGKAGDGVVIRIVEALTGQTVTPVPTYRVQPEPR